MSSRWTRLILAVVFLFSSQLVLSAAEAQTSSQRIGYCNIAAAVMLHPLMAHLDPSTGRFHGAAVQNGAQLIKQAATELEERRKQLLKEIESLRKEIAATNREFINGLHSLNREREKIEKNNKSIPQTPQSDDYTKKRAWLENVHTQNIAMLRSTLTSRESELEKLNNEARHADLLSVTETERVFKLILDDIYSASIIVTQREKLAFVFNSTAYFRFQNPEQAFIEGNPLAEIFDPDSQFKVKSGGDTEYALLSRLSRWVDSLNNLYYCNDARLGKFVISGGTDITSAVVMEVYKKHNVDSPVAEIVQKLFKSNVIK